MPPMYGRLVSLLPGIGKVSQVAPRSFERWRTPAYAGGPRRPLAYTRVGRLGAASSVRPRKSFGRSAPAWCHVAALSDDSQSCVRKVPVPELFEIRSTAFEGALR